MTLERIVRPFQTPDITPPRKIVSARNEEAPASVTLSFGMQGSGKVISGGYSWTQTRYMDQRLKEKRNIVGI